MFNKMWKATPSLHYFTQKRRKVVVIYVDVVVAIFIEMLMLFDGTIRLTVMYSGRCYSMTPPVVFVVVFFCFIFTCCVFKRCCFSHILHVALWFLTLAPIPIKLIILPLLLFGGYWWWWWSSNMKCHQQWLFDCRWWIHAARSIESHKSTHSQTEN